MILSFSLWGISQSRPIFAPQSQPTWSQLRTDAFPPWIGVSRPEEGFPRKEDRL